MKRIIWYAAAAGIFISSALAKPSHGAMLGDFVPLEKGGGTEMDAFCKNFGDLREWLAGFPASSGGTYISDETPDQGAEWFPGQGPSVWGDCGPGAGDCFPGGGGSSQAGNGQSAGDSAGDSSQVVSVLTAISGAVSCALAVPCLAAASDAGEAISLIRPAVSPDRRPLTREPFCALTVPRRMVSCRTIAHLTVSR